MPKSAEQIADELNDALRLKGTSVMTMLWPAFYQLCGIERFKEPRGTNIKVAARDKWGLIVDYGRSVVLVAHDRNFEPAP